ncbi:MAG: protein kinase [Gemmatimonadota bacterium]|nr:MAG: protein kinase [Gemmatimonadota bacterium]
MTDILPRLAAALADRYRIERELGEGGMATVYLAEDLKHDRKVALKVLKPELAAAIGSERFLAEIRTTAGLQHPNIVPLFDSGEAGGFVYYVMPYVAGESLRDKLARDGRFDMPAAVEIARTVAQALATAHEAGVVHRDIKPENILLVRDQPIVADFGIARALDHAGGERLTATGVAVGTPAYMSPEQAFGEEDLDARSDVYSLGCVIYEMLAGSPPFSGGSSQALIAQRLVSPPPSLTSVPPAVNDVVRRSLATEPADRFATALALAEALVTASTQPGTTRPSLVVLPFVNQSPDAENEFFADGLTEEIITDLAAVRALAVISRTSSMQLKGTTKDLRTIGREVGVSYVLEGSVRKAGQMLRITAQLVDARSDEQLWADKYGGTMDDVFEVQERVAREIVKALNVTLTNDEDRRLSERPIRDARAFELYVQARQDIRRFGPPVQRGLELLERVKEIEGDTIPLRALEALGKIYLVRSGLVPDHSPLDDAERMARAILADAPDFTYARGLIGYAIYERSGSANAAEVIGHLETALQQDPTDADFLFALGTAYLGAGLNDETGATATRYLACDPLSPLAWILAGVQHWFTGRLAESIPPIEHALELDSVNPMTHWCTGYSHALCGQLAEAKRRADVMQATASDFLYTGQLLGLVAALEGDTARALDHVRDVKGLDGHHKFHLAETFAMAGDHERALALLEESVEWFHPTPYLREHCPFLAPLRGQPRFEAYAARAAQLTEGGRRQTAGISHHQ